MSRPAHLEPSKLGTKEYWDALYTTEIANHAHDPADTGTAWFDDSDAETKLLEFLEDPERARELGLDTATTSFLDLGTGNGALLFALRDAGWEGPMLGVDYSAQSVRFARRIERARRIPPASTSSGEERARKGEEGDNDNNRQDDIGNDEGEEEEKADVHFVEHDILHTPATALLDPRFATSVTEGWDVILDKGTFDAISLSAETLDGDVHTNNGVAAANTSNTSTITTTNTTSPRRVNEAYGTRILPLVREGGIFLITSCNWTEAELKSWFEGDGAVQEIPTTPTTSNPAPDPNENNTTGNGNEEQQQQEKQKEYWGFEVVGRVEYRSFSFGGVKGQTISSLCFRKVRKSR
ncbi:hypothetical protein F5Y07DRAFT_295424 [Xylaria sp. FL0933]|nr:hypothetical protein F5Y07DRAFT_295424 [Xylaria sp. FL0933]